MSSATKKGATYEDLIAAPDEKVAELVYGDLYLSPRPAPRHAHVSSSLGADLHDAFHRGRSGPGGWWILDEPELHLGENVLVPDIAGWRRERLEQLPERAWFDIAPDWVCEVISPSTEDIDREKKPQIYAASGVGFLWIVDPSIRVLEVFRREADRWERASTSYGEDLVSAPPFEAVTIELGALWA